MNRDREVRQLLEAIVILQQTGMRIGKIVSSLKGKDLEYCDGLADDVCLDLYEASHTAAEIVLYLAGSGDDKEIANQ